MHAFNQSITIFLQTYILDFQIQLHIKNRCPAHNIYIQSNSMNYDRLFLASHRVFNYI